jgi:hypothetical protein
MMIRMSLSLLTALLLAGTAPLPAQAQTGPVQGVVKGTATVGTGVAQGTAQAGQGVAQGTVTTAKGVGQAGVGVARGTATVAKKTGTGVWCIVTLGYGCRP